MNNNISCLVTGCAGFIGSHLTDRLLTSGFSVTGIDSLSDYYDPGIKKENLKSALQNEKFTFIWEDILTSEIAEKAGEFDYIFHLAAQPGVRTSWGGSFNLYMENNILATQRLLESVRVSDRLKKFLFASSSSVYGEISKEKVSEDDPVRPFSPYGVTKLAAENLCELYRNNYKVPAVSLRFFTVYGPRQRPDMAFARLIRAAQTGEQFHVFGDGSQMRDYTYAADLVEGVVKTAFKEDAFGIFNIAGGSVISLNEVIGIVQKLSGKKIDLIYKSNEKGDVFRTGADISKLKRSIGYFPEFSIEAGLYEQIKSIHK